VKQRVEHWFVPVVTHERTDRNRQHRLDGSSVTRSGPDAPTCLKPTAKCPLQSVFAIFTRLSRIPQ
jgi:hypothetical protein